MSLILGSGNPKIRDLYLKLGSGDPKIRDRFLYKNGLSEGLKAQKNLKSYPNLCSGGTFVLHTFVLDLFKFNGFW